MTIFHLRSCDRSGRLLHDTAVDASDVHAALAHANRSFHRMARRSHRGLIDLDGRIDVEDARGNIVARLLCAEAFAASAAPASTPTPGMKITA